MKNPLLIIAALLLIFCLQNIQVSAQEDIKPKKVILINLIIPDEEIGSVTHGFELPVYTNLERVETKKNEWNIVTNDKSDSAELVGGGFSTVGCVKCSLTSEYSFWSIASKISDEKAKVYFSLTFTNKGKCNEMNQIFIISAKKSNIKLKCGVAITADYQTAN